MEATVFNLMQIGELAKPALSNDAKAQIPSIPWQQLYGMELTYHKALPYSTIVETNPADGVTYDILYDILIKRRPG